MAAYGRSCRDPEPARPSERCHLFRLFNTKCSGRWIPARTPNHDVSSLEQPVPTGTATNKTYVPYSVTWTEIFSLRLTTQEIEFPTGIWFCGWVPAPGSGQPRLFPDRRCITAKNLEPIKSKIIDIRVTSCELNAGRKEITIFPAS